MSSNIRTTLRGELDKLLGRSAALDVPVAIGGGTVLKTRRHALDGAEHSEATEAARLLATAAHAGLLLPLSGNAGDYLAGSGAWIPNSGGTTLVKSLTNKSGAGVVAGDVVVISGANADAFTTTTVAQSILPIGIAQATIANNAAGLVALAGYVPLVNVPGAVTLRHYAETNGTAKQAVGNATRRAGSFGVFLTGSATPDAILFGTSDLLAEGHEAATDPHTGYLLESLLDAKGDLISASADNTPAKLTVGPNGRFLQAASGEATGLKWASQAAASLTLYGSLADVPPASPGTYDEEFEGTADTLPTNWAWASAPSGSDEWTLNSRWPGLLTVEGTGNTLYILTRTGFTAAATFGLWAKIIASPQQAADDVNLRMYVKNSAGTDGRATELRSSAAQAPAARALKMVASAESLVGTQRVVGSGNGTLYVGITRGGSNNFTHWYSLDGLQWNPLGNPESHGVTIDRIIFIMDTSTVRSFLAIDWIRYRTDNLFPRP